MRISQKTSLSTLIVLAFACAPVKNQTSITRSLDNLVATGAGYTPNDCGAAFTSIDSVPARTKKYASRIRSWDKNLQLAALNALHHVPVGLTKPFFDQGGSIELSPNSIETCKSSKLTAKERTYIKESAAEVDSCWMQPDPKQPPVIVLPAKADRIRHNLLRVMVYFYSEYLLDRMASKIAGNKNYSTVSKAIVAFNQQKELLTDAFLDDAAVYNFNASKKLWDLRTDNENRFNNIVLAEAIDSYYCSADTFAKFKKHFQATYRLFSDKKKDSLAKALGTPEFAK